MAGELVPLVMIPRYTTYAAPNGQDFTTIAMDVTEYQNAVLNTWRSAMLPNGGSGDFKIFFEESTDQDTWKICAGTSGTGEDPGSATEEQYVAQLTRRWFRVRVKLAGTDATTTCWCVGFLEERER